MLNKPPTSLHWHRWWGRTFIWIAYRVILIGLLNSGTISVLLMENYSLCSFPCAAFKGAQTDYDRSVYKNYANAGQERRWDLWVKRRVEDKSLISLFAFGWLVFGKNSGPQGDSGNEEQTQVAWSPQGVASSKIILFKYFGWDDCPNNYPKVTLRTSLGDILPTNIIIGNYLWIAAFLKLILGHLHLYVDDICVVFW